VKTLNGKLETFRKISGQDSIDETLFNHLKDA